MDDGDLAQSLLGKKFAAVKAGWSADATDLIVLFSSFLLTTASIALIVLVFYYAGGPVGPPLYNWVFILQRAISALSATATSAVIVVVGKRYVFFKFARGGMHGRQVAFYSHPSLWKFLCHLMPCRMCHGGTEGLTFLPLLAVWVLGYATGFTANDVVTLASSKQDMYMMVPFGSLDAAKAPGSLLIPASSILNYVTTLLSLRAATRMVRIADDSMKLTSGGPTGQLFYPPIISNMTTSATYSILTALNGFNLSMESLSSIPPTAQNYTCVDSIGPGFSTGQLLYGGGDNQTLSITYL